MQENRKFLIDIASESEYQNQSEEYYRAYTEWRTNENNRFGYKFVKDIREHTYVEGEGYEYKEASDAESKALKSCASLLGASMLVSAAVRLLQLFFDERIAQLLKDGSVVLTGSPRGMDIVYAFALVGFKLMIFIAPLLIYAFVIKMPRAVRLPLLSKSRTKGFLMLGMLGGAGVLCYLSTVASRVTFNNAVLGIPGDYLQCGNLPADAAFFVLECLVLSSVQAMFFNGVLLQSLRQFGDTAAVFIVTVTEGIISLGVGYLGINVLSALLLGIITVKTGSISYAVLGRMELAVFFYAIRYIDNNSVASMNELYHILLCIALLAAALVCCSRLMAREDFTFNIENDRTSLSFGEKMKVFFTAMPMIEWFVAAVVAELYVILV